jgi:muramidase (phage lysozyme)
MHPNLQAFLNLVRECEGTSGPDGWRRRYNGNFSNGALFTDLSKHPCIKVGVSSAAGAFQIVCSTWKTLQVQLSLPDFSPTSQMAAAVQLIKETGAYDDIVAGRIDKALARPRLKNMWTSLPGGSQPKKTIAEAKNIYQTHGGAIAA